jgi:hypothetical protein
MSGAVPPIPQYAFIALYSVKKQHRDNFTFTTLAEYSNSKCTSERRRAVAFFTLKWNFIKYIKNGTSYETYV